jgi:hypothetical protein
MGRIERVVGVVRAEVPLGTAARATNRIPRIAVHDGSGRVGRSVAAIGAGGEQGRSGPGSREHPGRREGQLLTPSPQPG